MPAARKGKENWKVAKSFRLDKELDRRLTDRAEAERRSKSLVVSDAIEAYLEPSVASGPSRGTFPRVDGLFESTADDEVEAPYRSPFEGAESAVEPEWVGDAKKSGTAQAALARVRRLRDGS